MACFLGRRLGFLGIARVVEAVMGRLGAPAIPDLEAVLALDGEARRVAEAEAQRMGMAA